MTTFTLTRHGWRSTLHRSSCRYAAKARTRASLYPVYLSEPLRLDAPGAAAWLRRPGVKACGVCNPNPHHNPQENPVTTTQDVHTRPKWYPIKSHGRVVYWRLQWRGCSVGAVSRRTADGSSASSDRETVSWRALGYDPVEPAGRSNVELGDHPTRWRAQRAVLSYWAGPYRGLPDHPARSLGMS